MIDIEHVKSDQNVEKMRKQENCINIDSQVDHDSAFKIKYWVLLIIGAFSGFFAIWTVVASL